ncbi:MAG: fimbria/pilus outer membrane usher protein, partial [Burkholderiaceae bacterium]
MAKAVLLGASGAALGQALQAPQGVLARATLDAEGKLLTLDAIVNGGRGGAWPMLERSGLLYVPRDAFEEWRLPLPSHTEVFVLRGQNYYPLNGVPGFRSRIDTSNQSVDLTFSPLAFSNTRLAPGSAAATPPRDAVLPALLFNYDLNYSAARARDSASSRDLGLLSEAVWSGAWGVLVHSSVARNLTGESAAAASRRVIRLETTYTLDFPQPNRTLRLGDSVTRPGLLGRHVYFGGAQLASNYSFTPGFTGQALPVLSGVSSAPSTVELYVNDVLRQVSAVPAGPFSIDNFSGVSSAGEARIVVRDLLGRETVLVQPFFSHALLLATGHNEWSVEAGRQRIDFGNSSDAYGAAFGSALWRRGWTDQLTLEGRASATRKLLDLSGAATFELPWQSLGTAAFAASDEQTAGRGTQWLLGIERQSLQGAFQLQAQGATRRYRELGVEPDRLPLHSLLGVNASRPLGARASVGAGLVRQTFWDAVPQTTVASINFSMRLGERASLNLNASRVLDGVNASAAGVSLLVPLERTINAGVSVSRRAGSNDSQAYASQLPPAEQGTGWRVVAGHRLGDARA